MQNSFLMHAIMAVSTRHLHKLKSFPRSSVPVAYSLLEAQHLQHALSGYRSALTQGRDAIHTNQNVLFSTTFLLAIHACSVLDVNPRNPSEDTPLTFLRGLPSIVGDGPDIAYTGIWKDRVTPPHVLPPPFSN
jgi:hypothetical protein